MKVSPLAGKPATLEMLIDVPKLITAYYTEQPDVSIPSNECSLALLDIEDRHSKGHLMKIIFWQSLKPSVCSESCIRLMVRYFSE